jgi:hypothetical protein
MRMRVGLVIWAVCALTFWVTAASADKGGNSANARLCQKGGWIDLVGSDGTTFANQDACVAFGAHGGTLKPKTKSQIDCEGFGGTYSTDPATDHAGQSRPFLWSCDGTDPSGDLFDTLGPDCFADGGTDLARQRPTLGDYTCYL